MDATVAYAKAYELMEQAVELVMIGDQNLDLAKGYWNLPGGQARAFRPCTWPTHRGRPTRQV
jgi:hypothetical protein